MAKCTLTLDFSPILCHTNSMNKTTQLTNYGNGIYASNPFLADIARKCIERELMQRQCRAAARADGAEYGSFNISDTH